jgi:hypothetical protein
VNALAGVWAPVRKIAPPPPVPDDWWSHFNAHRDMAMPPQSYDWTCSICSVDWTLRATGLDPWSTREQTAFEMGYPECVNPQVGLASVQCAVNTLGNYGPSAQQEWADWDRIYQLCEETAGVLNSTTWYHFVAIRGVLNGRLWVANSAPGWYGIYDTISRSQFESLLPWQVVWLRQ